MSFALRKRGAYWYARGTVPQRQADGTIAKVRIEECTRETSKAKATRVAIDLFDYYREQAYRPKPKVVTFDEAAATFVETKQSSKRDREFLRKLVAHFGDTPINDIDQAAMAEACSALYPQGAKASTLHRAIYAPVTAVLRLSGVQPFFKKPKIQKAKLTVPDDEWFKKVLPHCDDQLKALILFLSITGRRISEALEATYDNENAYIGRTKTGHTISIKIPRAVLSLLGTRTNGSKIFRYGNRSNVYRSLRRACRMAGVDYHGSHAFGRHTFATRLLKLGYTTKFVAEAGGWASTRMVDTVYGHLEKTTVASEAEKVGDEWTQALQTATSRA
jgi:integrase